MTWPSCAWPTAATAGGADSALRAGMRMLSRYRAALGATELRVNAASHAADLARLGLGLAVEDGDATRALAWAERWRAGTLRLRPERPPDDVKLAADLAELRRVAGEVREAAAAGHDTTRLLNRQAALEEAVAAGHTGPRVRTWSQMGRNSPWGRSAWHLASVP